MEPTREGLDPQESPETQPFENASLFDSLRNAGSRTRAVVYTVAGMLLGAGVPNRPIESEVLDALRHDPPARTLILDAPGAAQGPVLPWEFVDQRQGIDLNEIVIALGDPSLPQWERQQLELRLSRIDPGAKEALPAARALLETLPLDAPEWQRDGLERFVRTRELGIEFPSRLSSGALEEIAQNRECLVPDGRPLALVCYPKGDSNGAFYLSRNIFDEMISAGYRVLYYEIESDLEFVETLGKGTALGTEQEQRAALLVVGGHGSRTTLVFGRGDGAEEGRDHLDFSDACLVTESGMSAALAEGGQIVLDSCSNGEGMADAENMANFVRELFPHAKERGIWSATESYGPLRLHFDETGELIRVEFPVPVYQARTGPGVAAAARAA